MNPRLAEHLSYVADQRRLARFREAIHRTIKPGDIVADLGCGTAILGLECLKAGAGHVFAVDETEMIHVARETFERAGLSRRATFVHGRSFRIELAERVDVAICDHVGFWGFDYGIVELLADARERLLKPGGVVLPRRLELVAGAVESEAARRLADGWRQAAIPPEYHWIANVGANAKHALKLGRGDMLSAPRALGAIELGAENAPFLAWSTVLSAERDGVLHGLAGWFECELAEGVAMTNSPHAEEPIDREQAFLPIGEPVSVTAGERIEIEIMIRPGDHILAWSVHLPRLGRRWRQSSFAGSILGADDLSLGDPGRIPRLTRAGTARAVVLGYCDGRRTAREIGELVLSEHPGLLPSRREISRFVAETLGRDAE